MTIKINGREIIIPVFGIIFYLFYMVITINRSSINFVLRPLESSLTLIGSTLVFWVLYFIIRAVVKDRKPPHKRMEQDIKKWKKNKKG